MLNPNERIEKIKNEILGLARTLAPNRVLVHADLMRAIPFCGDSKAKTLEHHIKFFNDTFQSPIWMPSFTYSTPVNHVYNIKNTPSEIGMLNEYYRLEKAIWRTCDPIYSYVGNGERPKQEFEYQFDTYGCQSVFSKFQEPGTFLLQYGCRNGTQKKILINYIEELANVPYRIKQFFETKIIRENGTVSNHQTYYQIHPKCGISDKYRVDLFDELLSEGIAFPVKDSTVLIDMIDVNKLIVYMRHKLKMNPFYLLTQTYQEWLKRNLIYE